MAGRFCDRRGTRAREFSVTIRGVIESLMILPVALPVLFWAAYHYHKDRHLPEPPGKLFVSFLLGGAAALVAKALYVGLGYVGLRYDAVALADADVLRLLGYALLAIGPIEEFAKLLPFVLVIIRFDDFDEPLDGIIYASFIALGFAAAENLYYLQFLTPIEALARGFASPVVHMMFASIWGYRISSARVSGRPLLAAAVSGFLIAALLHGLYDFVVLANPIFALPVAAALIATIWLWRLRLMRLLHREAVAASTEDAH